jgi:hypothetical protein
MNPAQTAKANVGRFLKDIVSSIPAAEPNPLTRQRKRAIAYTIALRAVDERYGTYDKKTGVTVYTIPRRARHRIARAGAKAALKKSQLHKIIKKED